eukprot:TRINITY_DN8857_c0_g1_i1.p1 TRINITY_DN8857_c0_g1~~TRINITY_DN8857_c0_g1_i1.p1  ORF type:complete len:418 (+),score=108.07 TRINITY_DN8857_c0_g1_i1:67-1254(+)
MEHINRLRVVGKGAFGKVHAIKRRDNGKLFAMKCMDKNEIIKEGKVNNVLSERDLWIELDHPLLVNLHCALQEKNDLYAIVDLMLGGDLRFHLQKEKYLDEDRVRFYAAQMAETLNYMHGIGILHRDIKPDNLLLDSGGNICFTDFNLSAHIPKRGIKGTAGTQPYMAPEMVANKRYGFPIDYWSMGITIYEFIYGITPFMEERWDDTKYMILNEEPHFHSTFHLSEEGKECILGLLEKDPKKRWGYEEMLNCSWCSDINFEAAGAKLLDTPWVPDPSKAYVSGIHDLDDQFQAKKKRKELTEEEQDLFKDWDYLPDRKSDKKIDDENKSENKSTEEEPELVIKVRRGVSESHKKHEDRATTFRESRSDGSLIKSKNKKVRHKKRSKSKQVIETN